MKYIAIDIETTGLDPEKHQILEFAAVYDNLDNPVAIDLLPKFVRKIKWTDYVICAYCLDLHQELLREIQGETANLIESPVFSNDFGPIYTDAVIRINRLVRDFGMWLGVLKITDGYNVAGKNFAGFDGLFLKKIPNFPPWYYRVIDVGSMYLTKEMNGVPGLKDISPIDDPHRALPDALAVVKAIRGKLL